MASGCVTDLDLNAGMLAVARTHTGGPRALIENQGQPDATTNAGRIVASDGQVITDDLERETLRNDQSRKR
jgi:hypothetical protein